MYDAIKCYTTITSQFTKITDSVIFLSNPDFKLLVNPMVTDFYAKMNAISKNIFNSV